mmetsp:Transcript_16414/g.25356  ORF Transcript_16414/g.25356 Transcript_16414/m.25356 type:complete len:127 (-) Transcript_16414:268-648(-)
MPGQAPTAPQVAGYAQPQAPGGGGYAPVPQQVTMNQGMPNNEDGETCCGCFPIKVGVTILGVFALISLIIYVFDIIALFSLGISVGLRIGYVCIYIPDLIAAVLFIKFLANDNLETRKALQTAVLL